MVSAVGSFVAGTISIMGLMVAATFLSDIALKFGPPEFFALTLCGLIVLVRLGGGSILQGFIMVLLGMAVATVGVDYLGGVERFTYGIQRLGEGISFLPVAMGIFGIAEVLVAVGKKEFLPPPKTIRLRELMPTRREWKKADPAMFRGSFIGFALGLISGPSTVISTFVSYMTEKKMSRNPEEFGHGAIEAVAGPEAANTAAVGGAYVPLFALGLPFTPAMAIVLAALMLHGLTPGPNLISAKPDLFWTVIASMYIGNVMLVVLNVPLLNVFVSILRIPQNILFPIIVVICVIGTYTVNASVLDLLMLAVFGFIGFALRGLGFPPAPLVLAMVIGPMLETSCTTSGSIPASSAGTSMPGRPGRAITGGITSHSMGRGGDE